MKLRNVLLFVSLATISLYAMGCSSGGSGGSVPATPQVTSSGNTSSSPTATPQVTSSSDTSPTPTPTSTPTSTDFKNLALKSSITRVQPLTGLVLWANHEKANSTAIQLEYTYVGYSEVVKNSRTDYNWGVIETLLNNARNHQHQAVLRFYDTYPGKGPDGNWSVAGRTSVPDYIKKLSDYKETSGSVEGEACSFPDWTNPEYQTFVKAFFTAFAAKYDNDPRLAYLEVGFGLWAEYHIWQPGIVLGKNFPSKDFQTQFANLMQSNFHNLRWMISIDAADTANTPMVGLKDSVNFGLFDDSFLQAQHATENAVNFKAFSLDRYQKAPVGGEISYYTTNDQKNALSATGPNGVSFATLASQFHVSFMIGNDQPSYQTMDVIKQAGLATGYKFKITFYRSSATETRITVKNIGIAPLYYDAYLTVDGKKATASLKLLQPGVEKEYSVNTPATTGSVVAIQCDRLVPGQKIEYEASL